MLQDESTDGKTSTKTRTSEAKPEWRLGGCWEGDNPSYNNVRSFMKAQTAIND